MLDERMSYEDMRLKARKDAQDVLKEYWSNGRIPVDPIEIARKMGLSVFTSQLGDDTWGMLVGSNGAADIYLDQDQSVTRMRFSCAHELGHYVDHKSDIRPHAGFIDKRSTDGVGRPAEVYANEFAASLLAPEAQLRELVDQELDIMEIARHFGMSPSSIEYRKSLLGI